MHKHVCVLGAQLRRINVLLMTLVHPIHPKNSPIRKSNCYLNCVLTLLKVKHSNGFREGLAIYAIRIRIRIGIWGIPTHTRGFGFGSGLADNPARKPLTSTFTLHFFALPEECVCSCFAYFHSCLPLHSFLGFWALSISLFLAFGFRCFCGHTLGMHYPPDACGRVEEEVQEEVQVDVKGLPVADEGGGQ